MIGGSTLVCSVRGGDGHAFRWLVKVMPGTMKSSPFVRFSVGLIVTLGAGYVSNAVTAPACKRATEGWVDSRVSSSSSLLRNGFVEPARCRLPYFVSLDYEYQTDAAPISSGRRHFFCLFGLPLWIRDSRTIVTPVAVTDARLPDFSDRALDAEMTLGEAFSDAESIVFRSFNGEWQGFDCDTDIELKRDGDAIVTAYRNAIKRVECSYSIQDGRVLVVNIVDARLDWPSMFLLRDDTTLLLYPADSKTLQGDSAIYWPLRQLRAQAR
jgi:hypothetical protein